MKNILQNKLFLIFSIFILIIISISSSCFANFTFTTDDKEYNFPDLPAEHKNYNNILIFDTLGTIYLTLFTLDDENNINDFYYGIGSEDFGYEGICFRHVTGKYYQYNDTTKSFKFYRDLNYNSSSEGFLRVKFLYSTKNIYNLEGNLVFQKAPQKVEQMTIQEITRVEEIPQVMSQVAKMIIPIGLAILLIGLVIFLMRLVISQVK